MSRTTRLMLALALLAACGGRATPPPAAHDYRSLPASALPYTHSSDDLLVAIAVAVPGFAGFYYDPYPTPWISLVDPSRAEAARAEVTRVLERNATDARIRTVKYDFVELKRWQLAVEWGQCGALPGLTMWDTDEFKNVVAVGVAEERYAAAVRQCGIEAGIPPDALDVSVVGPFVPL